MVTKETFPLPLFPRHYIEKKQAFRVEQASTKAGTDGDCQQGRGRCGPWPSQKQIVLGGGAGAGRIVGGWGVEGVKCHCKI